MWGPPGAVTSRVRGALPPSRRRALNQERLLSDLGCARSAQRPRQSAERMARTPGRALQKGLGSRQGLKCGLTGSCHRAKNTGLGANSLNLNLSSAANGQVM